MKQDKKIESKPKISQEKDRTSIGNLADLEHEGLEKHDLGNKICKELENEEFEKTRDSMSPSANNLGEY